MEQSHFNSPIRFKDSRHLNIQNYNNMKSQIPTRVAITQISENETDFPPLPQHEISECVAKALSGSRSGSIQVSRCDCFTGDFVEVEALSLNQPSEVDIWVVACSGSFTFSLKVSQMLRNRVEKVADSLAMQARLGAAAQEATAALFESLVGFLTNGQADNNGVEVEGCMLVALPLKGLEGGLDNVRGLLKHAVKIARGKPHDHHHRHHH